MHVIATAGHVDHGKSLLVRALTGMEPDRWEAEQRRGMTIDLGFAWMTLPSGEAIAFVDVPGHERFITNMLAGAGPALAVMFVVAADEGWKPQSAEHLAAIDALGVRHGVLVITRADLADPAPALRQALLQIAGPVSARAPVRKPWRSARSPARACPTWPPRSAGSRPGSPNRTRVPVSGCGWTGCSPSRASGPWSPEPCRPGPYAPGTN